MAAELPLIAPYTALAAGAVSFVSPCVLPLVPGYVSFVVGETVAQRHGARFPSAMALVLSSFFVLGFSTIFIILGASASALGQSLAQYREHATLVGAVVVIVFGLFMIGALRLPLLMRDVRFHGAVRGGRPFGAYVLGLAFAFGWTPCIGPVLGTILTASALSSTASEGAALLAIYSAGLGVPFVLTAAFAHAALSPLRMLRRVGRALQVLAGVVMIFMGLAMLGGYTTALASWLLRTFPPLGVLG